MKKRAASVNMLTLDEVVDMCAYSHLAFANLSGAKYLQIVDTLEAALQVVGAAKEMQKESLVSDVLEKALEPFRRDGE